MDKEAALKYKELLDKHGSVFESWIDNRFQNDLIGLLSFTASAENALKIFNEFETTINK